MAKSAKVTIKVLGGEDDEFAVVACVGISTLINEVVVGRERAMDTASCLRAFYIAARGVEAVNHKIMEPSL